MDQPNQNKTQSPLVKRRRPTTFLLDLPCDPIKKVKTESVFVIDSDYFSQETSNQSNYNTDDCMDIEKNPKEQPTSNELENNQFEKSSNSSEIPSENGSETNLFYLSEKTRRKSSMLTNISGYEKETTDTSQSSNNNQDDEQSENCFTGHFLYFTNTNLIEELQQVLKQNQASMIEDINCLKPDTPINLSCFMKHKWNTTFRKIQKGEWCPKCQTQLTRMKDYAEYNNGKCLNVKVSHSIKFECSHGHQWLRTYRNWNKNWCSQCENNKKEQFRQKLKIEEQERMQEDMRIQQELFKEAKEKLIKEEQLKNQLKLEKNINQNQRIIDSFQNVEKGITKLAEQRAENFKQVGVPHKHSVSVHKTLLIPDEILRLYLGALSKDKLKTEYRKLALSIHPDKNKHEKAGIAFNKLNHYYSLALQRWNDSR